MENAQKFQLGPGIVIVQRGLGWWAEVDTGSGRIERDLHTSDHFEAVGAALTFAKNPSGGEIVRWKKAYDTYFAEHSLLYHCKSTRYRNTWVLAQFGMFVGEKVGDPDVPLVAINRERIEAWIREIAVGRSPSTVNSYLLIIRAFLRWCLGREWLQKDPTRGIRRLKVTKHDNKELSPEEIGLILKAGKEIDDPLVMDLFLLGLNTGARPGELQHLLVEDADLKTRTLYIRSREEYKIKDRADRRLKLNDVAVEVIQRRLKIVGDKPVTVLFPNRYGGFLHSCNVGHRFKIIARHAGVERATLYHCRHTFATLCAASMPQFVLQQIMGHSTPDLTARHYIHGAISQAAPPPNIRGAKEAKRR